MTSFFLQKINERKIKIIVVKRTNEFLNLKGVGTTNTVPATWQ